ncbi:hypothetical protein AGMMS50230_18600 [Spirochaetia bacterium]|nr:hypothetical protein AGMMS50230_18600 [Spirochaetia bacterium]
MTLPDDWLIHKRELYTHFTEGKAALDNGFAELERAGYINKRLIRDGHGHIMATEYTVFESAEMNDVPKSENRITVKPTEIRKSDNGPKSDYPKSDELLSDNRTLLNTDLTKDLEEPKTENYKYTKNGSSSSNTTTTIISNFLRECRTLGFVISGKKARSLLESGINPEWLSGPECFPSFIAAFVSEAYQDKADYERKRLFISALTWEDKREEYQDWLEKQKAKAEKKRQKEEAESERQRKEALQLATPKPSSCLNCGAELPLDTDLCPKCDHYSAWDDETGAYVAQKRFDFAELMRGMREKGRISNDQIGDVDIDQYFREPE